MALGMRAGGHLLKSFSPSLGLLLIAGSWGLLVTPAQAIAPKVIYGEDNRLDYYQVQNPQIRALSERTVALIRTANLDPQGAWTNLRTNGYGESYGLCTDEPYYDQPTVAFCSGSLVAPDVVISAGHCVRDQSSCDRTSFVFGYRLSEAGQMPTRVPTSAVYTCRHLIQSKADPKGEDFSVIQLDRAVLNLSPLTLSQTPVAQDTPLMVMGHPAGLPLKIASGANVRSLGAGFFVANLDTYGGNSGSAVFDAQTGLVAGILVRGEYDFENAGSCRRSKRCESSGCRGEDVTHIEAVMPFLTGYLGN